MFSIFTHNSSLVPLHGFQADSQDLIHALPAELLGRELQHLGLVPVDLDLGRAHHGDGDPLLGVDAGAAHLQRHRVQGDPQHVLDARQHDRAPARDEGRLPALSHFKMLLKCY